MAHKTLIGGTAYEISGGKTLVGGTAYEIKNGKTLVGGTAYEISFGIPIIISGTGFSNNMWGGTFAWVEINGTTYNEAQTLNLPVDTVIKCCIKEGYSKGKAKIILNGNTVVQSSAYDKFYYNYTVKENVKRVTISLEIGGSGTMGFYGTVSIIEE